MPFRPNVHDELTLNGVTYRIAEHPAAPGIPYGQEGRAGIVYCLERSPLPSGAPFGDDKGSGVRAALKVFRARFRTPALVSQAEKLAAFADLPGLTVCRRTVLTPQRNADLLRREPDLTYAVLMPWIEGPTWVEVMLEKRPLTPQQALDLARAFAQVLVRMEEQGLAHCDLSGPNVLLPMLAGQTADGRPQTAYSPSSTVELVDVEGLYAPGLPRPEVLPSGSSGYAHRTAREGLWGPTADRFAGAVLLAEMLGWGDETVREACYGETYFDPAEMPSLNPPLPPGDPLTGAGGLGVRAATLLSALARHYGQPVADLFERAWTSETLADCPTFGEWLVALPESVSSVQSSVFSDQSSEGSEQTGDQESSITAIRALMQAARRLEEQNKLESALEVYRQALELAQADPSLRSLAREIELTVQDVEKRVAAQPSRPQPAISPRPVKEGPGSRVISPLPPGEGPGVRAEPRRKGGWAWALGGLAGLVVCCVLAAIVYVVNLQQQQAAQATATAQAAQATATIMAVATQGALIDPNAKLVFGPVSGNLIHGTNDGWAYWGSGIKVKNFILEVEVSNPYANFPWTLDIVFRQTYNADNAFYLYISSDSTWALDSDRNGTWRTVSRGKISNLNVSANRSNLIRLIVKDSIAKLYINGVFVSTLDVSSNTFYGDIALAIGQGIPGKSTEYKNFTVWGLP